MTRPAPRTRRPTRAAITQSVAARSPVSDVDPADAGWERALDLTRAMLGASLAMSRDLMQGLCTLQQAQAASTRHACERLGEVSGQVERAPDWPSLLAAQAALAGTQWTQSMQDLSALCAQCMQIESHLLDRSRSDATQLSQRFIGNADHAPADPAAAALEAPLELARQSQAAMAEMSRWWSSAVRDSVLPD